MSLPQGDYQPLEVTGPHRDHVIAFARRHGRDAAIVAVARSFAPFTDGGRSGRVRRLLRAHIDIERLFGEGIDAEIDVAAFRTVPASACRGAEGEIRRAREAGAKAEEQV